MSNFAEGTHRVTALIQGYCRTNSWDVVSRKPHGSERDHGHHHPVPYQADTAGPVHPKVLGEDGDRYKFHRLHADKNVPLQAHTQPQGVRGRDELRKKLHWVILRVQAAPGNQRNGEILSFYPSPGNQCLYKMRRYL